MGTTKEGCGGLSEQIPHQNLDPQCKRFIARPCTSSMLISVPLSLAIIMKIKQLAQ
jgi:hypothetical protein